MNGTVIVSQRFDPEDALQVLQDYQVTHSNWVPTHFVRLLRLPEKVRRRNAGVSLLMKQERTFCAGIARPSVGETEQMIEWWGNAIVELITVVAKAWVVW